MFWLEHIVGAIHESPAMPKAPFERSTKGTSFASLSRLRFGKMAPLPNANGPLA